MQYKLKKIFKNLILLTFFTIVFLPSIALAADPPTIGGIGLPTSRFDSVGDLVRGIINWLLLFTGIVAVFAIIYSGIMYMTAGGDAEKAATARKNLIWAITGTVLVLLSFAIVNWISGIFTPR